MSLRSFIEKTQEGNASIMKRLSRDLKRKKMKESQHLLLSPSKRWSETIGHDNREFRLRTYFEFGFISNYLELALEMFGAPCESSSGTLRNRN
jgi:hypothetical protein